MEKDSKQAHNQSQTEHYSQRCIKRSHLTYTKYCYSNIS